MSPPITATWVDSSRPSLMIPSEFRTLTSCRRSSTEITGPWSARTFTHASVRIRNEVKNGTTTSPSSRLR